jgi:hypothetical protein
VKCAEGRSPEQRSELPTSVDQIRLSLLRDRLAYHPPCLREDSTDPEMTTLERLALVRDRPRRIQEIWRQLQVY